MTSRKSRRWVYHSLTFSTCLLAVSMVLLVGSVGSGSRSRAYESGTPVTDKRSTPESKSVFPFADRKSLYRTTEENSPLSITASSCIAGSLAAATPTYNRITHTATGSGIQGPGCTLNAGFTAVRYQTYQFNLTGCAAFPTQVTVSLCPGSVGGSGLCAAPAAATDTIVYIYRTGGSLTVGTGAAAAFNPTNACTNVAAVNDDLDGTAIAAGGSACDGALCHPTCNSPNDSTSGMFRTLGPGFFQVVVGGFGNSTVGNYNLFVNAPGAGCSLVGPTASSSTVSGRIVDSNGNAVAGAVMSLSGTQNRKSMTDADGNYRFEEVETNGFYTVSPWRPNYSFSPLSRSFSQLGETTDAGFNATFSAHATPIDSAEYFVRQHYLDFLGREPDEDGLNFWADQMLECGGDADCFIRRRDNVSAAYFLSIEFQETGGLVDGLYRASYGRRPTFAEFMPDAHTLGDGVVVGRANWPQQLAANKLAFGAAFVNRPAFRAAYDSLADGAYVDALMSHTGVTFTPGEHDSLVSGLTNGSMSRAEVLTRIAENNSFVQAKRNEMFVMMEYFGYLRRDPDASGFQFWLDKLNHFDGNFERAEMVRAFLVSGEFRERFPR